MKTRLFSFFAASFAALFLAAGCQEKPEEGTPAPEDNYITVTPDKIEATWEEGVFDVAVESNCSWTITKTDSEGTPVDWVQCDITSGKDNKNFQILVQENKYAERSATVTLTCGDLKAFIDVVQESNPTPVVPKPEVKLYEYYFEFAGANLGWPVQNEGWAGRENVDSGLAIDLGTETDDAQNLRRKCQVKYTLDGVDYYFTFADPHGATAHQVYLVPEGVHCGGYRYFGLPAVEGKKLVKIVMVQAASQKDASYERLVGVTSWVYNVEDTQAGNIKWVDGGEPQKQNDNMGTYTYELNGTSGNTVYYLAHPSKAGRIHSLRLFYADVDGTEPAPEPEPVPEAKPVDPTPDTPEVPVGPEPENTVKYTFDFTGAPFEGWPTAKATETGAIPCVYTLDGKDYTFSLTACLGASAIGCHWVAPVEAEGGVTPGYFNFYAEKRYLGLPAIEGYYLYRIVCTNAKMSTTVPEIGVTSVVAAGTNHPAAADYVAGGACQKWDANGGGTYTYTLGGTTAGTMYYMYAYKKGAIATLELTYAPAK